jgi:hypothetical protein
MRSLDVLVTLFIALSLTAPGAELAVAGGKGEIIEDLLLFGLKMGATKGAREYMQGDTNTASGGASQLPKLDTTRRYPDPCSFDTPASNDCGSPNDLLDALKAVVDKPKQEKGSNPIVAVCDQSEKTYDGLKCLQERQLREQSEAVKGETAD